MFHNSKNSKDSNRNSQGESPLKEYRRKAPFRLGVKKYRIECENIIDPYSGDIKNKIQWLTDRPSFANNLLEHLQEGVTTLEEIEKIICDDESAFRELREAAKQASNGKDNESADDLVNDPAAQNWKRVIDTIKKAYNSPDLEEAEQYGFGNTHGRISQKGPEAGWLKHFYLYTLKLLEAMQFEAVKEILASLKKACDLQQSNSTICYTLSKKARQLYQEIHNLEKRKNIEKDKCSKADIRVFSELESELVHIDEKADKIKQNMNSSHKELENALTVPKRLWNKKYPEQDKKEQSKQTSKSRKSVTRSFWKKQRSYDS
ncbi:uncharacterized protein FOMMEDRAFT_25628 [Fomitiporia mediterranea MF3/22]|uniref:uncharacterized protein n=1 Tax=Fomitiporia mediterranea (strain MF3/22) TaxID=694068 RepID=UPI00044074C6|nr:uncharacterized protein FOMMEDRAFT_25628 [Fomitiporia mediterranea MF3/22]EJD06312.1 hypothetical protein FOMMEDRAFT_25628 [Fomitiporia mediterranea MF3/22]